MSKTCSKCGTIKVLDEFANDRSARDKKTAKCKQCLREYKKNRGRQEIVAFNFFD